MLARLSRVCAAGRPLASAAAKLAGVHDAILRLPEGYDTIIGPTGLTLARGERQLISLARAVFGDPRLVVLDEPSLELDKSGEKSLIKLIRALRDGGVVVIVISHRASILNYTDKVLMLPTGNIVGSKQENRDKSELHLIKSGKSRA